MTGSAHRHYSEITELNGDLISSHWCSVVSVGQLILGFGSKIAASTWQYMMLIYQARSAQVWETWGIFRYAEKTSANNLGWSLFLIVLHWNKQCGIRNTLLGGQEVVWVIA